MLVVKKKISIINIFFGETIKIGKIVQFFGYPSFKVAFDFIKKSMKRMTACQQLQQPLKVVNNFAKTIQIAKSSVGTQLIENVFREEVYQIQNRFQTNCFPPLDPRAV